MVETQQHLVTCNTFSRKEHLFQSFMASHNNVSSKINLRKRDLVPLHQSYKPNHHQSIYIVARQLRLLKLLFMTVSTKSIYERNRRKVEFYAKVFSVEDWFERVDSEDAVFLWLHCLKTSHTFFRKFFPTMT